jgi:hypothetical protein
MLSASVGIVPQYFAQSAISHALLANMLERALPESATGDTTEIFTGKL